MDLNNKLQEVLIKKATGYTVEESVFEYGNQEDELKLLKKKVSLKYYPPDLSAINMLLNSKEVDLKTLSIEELEEEKNRLLDLLNNLKE